MAKELIIEEENKLVQRKNSIKDTLISIGFPENLIDDEVYETMIKIQFEDIKIKDNKESIFKNFSKNNTGNGKFKNNLLRKNIDFNIKPLFEKYHLSLKKENQVEILKEQYVATLNVYLVLLKIHYLIVNDSIYTPYFDDFFINFNMKNIHNLSYFKGTYMQFEAYNNFEVQFNESKYISKENFRDLILNYLNSYKKLFQQKLKEKSFILSPEVTTLDSFDLLYFKTLNSIYYLFLKNDINTSEIDRLIGEFEDKKSSFNIKYSSKEELVYKFFYFYQSYKVYSNHSLLDSSITDDVLSFYTQKFKKTSNYSYRTKDTSLLSKNELIALLNETDKSNFCRNINKFEKFINNFFYINDQKLSIKKDLDTYSLYYQELFHNKEKDSNKIITKFIKNENIRQSDFEFIIRKLNRISFIDKMSVEKYKKFIEFQIKLRKIYTNNLYDENSTVLFDLIEKSLKLYSELNFKNSLKKVNIYLDNRVLDTNVYSTKHNKK